MNIKNLFQQKWFINLSLIFVFPLGVFLLWKYSNKSVAKKIVTTITMFFVATTISITMLVSMLESAIAPTGNNSSSLSGQVDVGEDIDVKKLISSNPQINIGNITKIQRTKDWAYGQRFNISTGSGEYLIYVFENDIVEVWDTTNERKEVFRKDFKVPELPSNSKRDADTKLPEYTILFQVKIAGTEKYGPRY